MKIVVILGVLVDTDGRALPACSARWQWSGDCGLPPGQFQDRAGTAPGQCSAVV